MSNLANPNCEYCEGEGWVPCDEWDNDAHVYVPGVGQMICLCVSEAKAELDADNYEPVVEPAATSN